MKRNGDEKEEPMLREKKKPKKQKNGRIRNKKFRVVSSSSEEVIHISDSSDREMSRQPLDGKSGKSLHSSERFNGENFHSKAPDFDFDFDVDFDFDFDSNFNRICTPPAKNSKRRRIESGSNDKFYKEINEQNNESNENSENNENSEDSENSDRSERNEKNENENILLKYIPETEDDLVVNKKKVNEVKSWLSNCFSAENSDSKTTKTQSLLLIGPPGSGKSCAIKVLCKEMNIEICEYVFPIPTSWKEAKYFSATDIPYTSKLEDFETFLNSASIYPMLNVYKSNSNSNSNSKSKSNSKNVKSESLTSSSQSTSSTSSSSSASEKRKLVHHYNETHQNQNSNKNNNKNSNKNSNKKSNQNQNLNRNGSQQSNHCHNHDHEKDSEKNSFCQKKILLIEDFPTSFHSNSSNRNPQKTKMHDVFARLIRTSRFPCIFVFSENAKEGFIEKWKHELMKLFDEFKIRKIRFNPIIERNVCRVLNNICTNESKIFPKKEIIQIAIDSKGDLRNAILSLQFCLFSKKNYKNVQKSKSNFQSEQNSKMNKKKKQNNNGDHGLNNNHLYKYNDFNNDDLNKNGLNTDDFSFFSSFSMEKDLKLCDFHALAKFLHNKRLKKETIYDEEIRMAESLKRSALDMEDAESIFSKTNLNPSSLIHFLHENYVQFAAKDSSDQDIDDMAFDVSVIDEVALMEKYLSDASLLDTSPSHYVPFGYNDAVLKNEVRFFQTEDYEPLGLVRTISASVAARGVLFSNTRSGNRKFQALSVPSSWKCKSKHVAKMRENKSRAKEVCQLIGGMCSKETLTLDYLPYYHSIMQYHHHHHHLSPGDNVARLFEKEKNDVSSSHAFHVNDELKIKDDGIDYDEIEEYDDLDDLDDDDDLIGEYDDLDDDDLIGEYDDLDEEIVKFL